MSAIGSRIEVWPGRDLRRAARAAGCDADQVAAAVRWRAGLPPPGDDGARWNAAFMTLLEAASADRGADEFNFNFN